MVTQHKRKHTNLIYRRLKEALQDGREVWIRLNDGSRLGGVPISLDREAVEVLVLIPPEGELPDDGTYGRIAWLIRLDYVMAIAYPAEYWSKDRLTTLLTNNGVLFAKEDEGKHH